MVLRVEDLDPRASNPVWTAQLLDDLLWLGLDWDEGPFLQSRRLDRYHEAIRLITEAKDLPKSNPARRTDGGRTYAVREGGRYTGHTSPNDDHHAATPDVLGCSLADTKLVYPCFCTRADLHAASAPHASDGTYLYAGTCKGLTHSEITRLSKKRAPALRIAVPHREDRRGTIDFVDAVYGPQHDILSESCGDFIIRRSDGIVAYQLAVVVDDAEMGITQVVRGRDLLGSTARQIWLAHLLGHTPPHYAHIPLLVSTDGRRLSKRDHDLDLGVIKEQGYSARSVIGSLAYAVGLASRGESVTAEQLIDRFSWETVRDHREDIIIGSRFLH